MTDQESLALCLALLRELDFVLLFPESHAYHAQGAGRYTGHGLIVQVAINHHASIRKKPYTITLRVRMPDERMEKFSFQRTVAVASTTYFLNLLGVDTVNILRRKRLTALID